jgi:hypothetical protein
MSKKADSISAGVVENSVIKLFNLIIRGVATIGLDKTVARMNSSIAFDANKNGSSVVQFIIDSCCDKLNFNWNDAISRKRLQGNDLIALKIVCAMLYKHAALGHKEIAKLTNKTKASISRYVTDALNSNFSVHTKGHKFILASQYQEIDDYITKMSSE